MIGLLAQTLTSRFCTSRSHIVSPSFRSSRLIYCELWTYDVSTNYLPRTTILALRPSSGCQLAMTWRSFHLSHRCSRSRIPNSPFPYSLLLQSRAHCASAVRTTKPNVAAVLNSKPSDDCHAVTVTGSVRTIRNQKYRSFLELGDGSTTQTLQALLEPAQADGYVLTSQFDSGLHSNE